MIILLDTHAYSGLMEGRPEVVAYVKRAEKILLSEIVIGELLFGFRNGTKYEQNFSQLQNLLNHVFVHDVPVTRETSDRYSRIATVLRKKGQPIPTNDLWIAAHTLQTGAELLSYDRHFGHVDGLVWNQLVQLSAMAE